MKYPLSRSEWIWFTLGIIMIAGMTVGFGLLFSWIMGDKSVIALSAILGLLFIYGKLIIPLLDRI